MTDDIPMDEDPHYTTKDRKCKSCGEMNTGSDTCSGPCGQCWACNCDCETDWYEIEELTANKTFMSILDFVRVQSPGAVSHERGEELRQAVIDARNDLNEDGNQYPELMDYLLYFVRKGTPFGEGDA